MSNPGSLSILRKNPEPPSQMASNINIFEGLPKDAFTAHAHKLFNEQGSIDPGQISAQLGSQSHFRNKPEPPSQIASNIDIFESLPKDAFTAHAHQQFNKEDTLKPRQPSARLGSFKRSRPLPLPSKFRKNLDQITKPRPRPSRHLNVFDLPNELFSQALRQGNFSLRELWSLLGVNREWRSRMLADKLLWRNELDMGFFRPQMRALGCQRLVELAGGYNFSSLIFCRSVFWESLVLDALMKVLTQMGPRLHTLRLALPVLRASVLQSVPAPQALQMLDIRLCLSLDILGFVNQIGLFPNLQELSLRSFSSPLTGSVPTIFSWGNPNTARNLRKLRIEGEPMGATSGRAVLTTLHESLTAVAPNLEQLELRNFVMCMAGNVSVPMVKFQDFHKLKVFSFLDGAICRPALPQLPPSLEELHFTIHGAMNCRAVPSNSWSVREQEVPTLPKLRVLTTNFDAPVSVATPSAAEGSMWHSLQLKSKCNLEEVYLEDCPVLSSARWSTKLVHRLLSSEQGLASLKRLRFDAHCLPTQERSGMNLHLKICVELFWKCIGLEYLSWGKFCQANGHLRDFVIQLISRPGSRMKHLHFDLFGRAHQLADLIEPAKERGVTLEL